MGSTDCARPPNSEFKVVIKVRSFFSLPDRGPKTYYGSNSKPVTVYIERDRCSLLDLVDAVGENFIWGSKQYISFWHSLINECVRITTDVQLLEWFDLNRKSGVVHTDAQVDDLHDTLQCSSTDWWYHPSLRNKPVDPHEATIPTVVTQQTQPEQNTKSKGRRGKTSVKYKKELVSVEKEVMHADNDSMGVDSDSSYGSAIAASSDSESDDETIIDKEVLDYEGHASNTVYHHDPDIPCIDEGVIFSDVDSCKAAVTHHAILNDFAFKTEKKDSERFRAYCYHKDSSCQWKFHASISKKYSGCKVKVNRPAHTCSSVNKCGATMATNNWVADRSVEWLKEKPTLGAKELQEKIEKKYAIKISYDKVFKGKDKALDMIYGKWDES
ncbi:hypothetical protein QOZ80_4AG0320050 [Eleusine coracana subsp. coracana]|nr:hypothetical protein QOZ80_4AG0320050 [Eleusine coracana subsp. coracana]